MEEKNNKEEKQAKRQRSTSVFTVVLWLLLVAVMVTITVSGVIKDKNAAEGETRTITIKIDYNDMVEKIDMNSTIVNEIGIGALKTNEINSEYDELFNGSTCFAKFITRKNNIATYQIEVPSEAKYLAIESGLLLEFINQDGDTETIYDKTYDATYYGVKILDGVDEYNLKANIDGTRKITVNIDGITSSYLRGFALSKNNIKDKFELYLRGTTLDGHINFTKINTENGISTYEIIVPNKTEYIAIYNYDNAKVLVDSNTNLPEVINIENFGESEQYTGIKLVDNINEYNLRVVDEETIDISSDKLNESCITNIKWIDGNTAELDLTQENGNRVTIFSEKLDDNFVISSKYENDSDWLIVNEDEIKDLTVPDYARTSTQFNLSNNNYIPEYIYASFFACYKLPSLLCNTSFYSTYRFILSDKKYIYVKDKNMLYFSSSGNLETNIELEYKGRNYGKEKYNFEMNIINFYEIVRTDDCGGVINSQYYSVNSCNFFLEYVEKDLISVTVNKIKDGESGSNTYYAGVFSNDIDTTTDKIYEIDTVDGVGSVDIAIFDFDSNANYYIYEVDSQGNKILDEGLIYSKNKVLENVDAITKCSVESNKDIISADAYGNVEKVSKTTNYDYNYIGVFENQTDDTTDVIFKSEDGVEFIEDSYKVLIYEISNYDDSKQYFVYEVDENGNKIGELYDYVFDGYIEVLTEETVETLPDSYYVDNSLAKTTTYQDSVTIKNNDKAYLVTYELEKGGTLDGTLQEQVRDGEKPTTVPNVNVDEYYGFIGWYVEESGEFINVEPLDYTITSDTTFIARFEKEKYTVIYTSEDGGSLSGETIEEVTGGETSKTLPEVIANENYEFDKWVIIVDNVEVSIDPLTYVITSDTMFIAKFKIVPSDEPVVESSEPNTSDINIMVYIVIFLIAIIGVIVGMLVIKNNKNKVNKNSSK